MNSNEAGALVGWSLVVFGSVLILTFVTGNIANRCGVEQKTMDLGNIHIKIEKDNEGFFSWGMGKTWTITVKNSGPKRIITRINTIGLNLVFDVPANTSMSKVVKWRKKKLPIEKIVICENNSCIQFR